MLINITTIEMLSTKEMNEEERLKFVRSLFDASVKLEEQRALEKKLLGKRKREESGNSINSIISTAPSNKKHISPPNKKRREYSESSKPEKSEDSQSSITNADTTNEGKPK